MNLNASQLAAVAHRNGPAFWLAGPGSGKTESLKNLVAALLREGLLPGHILCSTFSKDAALEMAKRVAKETGFTQDTIKKSISTFHSLALRLVLAERAHLGFDLSDNPVIADAGVKRLLRQFVSKDAVYEQKAYNAAKRRTLVTPEFAIRNANGDLELAEVYNLYDEELRAQGLLDFDSMIYRAVKLLEGNSEVRTRWQSKFRYVIIDEAHDNDFSQKALAGLLAGANQNLILILDPSQSIYSFRGADPEAILADSGRAAKFYLGTNYRSHSEIIEAFSVFAEQDELSQKLVREMRSAKGPGGNVVVKEFRDEDSQANEVCEEIEERIRAGYQPEDCAVLARTRALLLPYCELLEERGIPYHWRGKNFWASPEVEDAIAFCRLAIDPNDKRAWMTAITSPAQCSKYLNRQFATAVCKSPVPPMKLGKPSGEWRDYQITQWAETRATVRSLAEISDSQPENFLRGMMLTTGLGFYDSQTGGEPDDFGKENLEALVRRSAKFETLLEFVRHAERMKQRARKLTQKGVALSTIHAAKGLEWSSVFVIGVSKDTIPHKRSTNFDEERRLMYVALSRPKKHLWVSSHGEKSVFINYLPEKFREPSFGFAKALEELAQKA